MEKLEVLDLEGNKVDDLGALVYLGWCPQLAVLTLADNLVAQEATYSAQVLMHLHIASHAWWVSSMLCMSDNHAVYIYTTMPFILSACCSLNPASTPCDMAPGKILLWHAATDEYSMAAASRCSPHLMHCHVQVCAALPKLQVLDDTKLERPLSVSKPAYPHRQPHSDTAGCDAHASSHAANHYTSSQAMIMADPALHEFGLITALGSDLSQHESSNVMLAKGSLRRSRQQRPASASRLQQRLPPVAVGHNQPGSYLLYSLSQLPTDALQHTAQSELKATVPALAPKSHAVAGTAQHAEGLRLGQSFGKEAYADLLGGTSDGANSRKVRPASAGIRRAESRLQSSSISESSRYHSPASQASAGTPTYHPAIWIPVDSMSVLPRSSAHITHKMHPTCQTFPDCEGLSTQDSHDYK